jgi:putative Ig domain-containing protein
MRKLSLLVSLCSITFLSLTASGQTPDAANPFFGHPDNGQACHVVPTTDALERHFGKKPSLANASKTATVYPPSYGSGLLISHGGPEISNAAFQAIYWNSSVATSTSTSNGYATVQNQVDGFITDFADNHDWDNSATDDYTIIQQYGTNSSTPISPMLGLNPLNGGGAFVDSQADVSTITDAQIQTYIAGLLSAGKLPVNSNTIYGVFFPAGTSVQLSSTEASCTYFCAYHSGFYYNNNAVIYAVFPYPNCGGCNPWNYAAADMLTMFIGHEVRESVTDAYGAWYDSQGYEADDKCAWSNLYRTASGNFFVQPEFSDGGTVTASGFTATYPGSGCIVPSGTSGPLSISGPASLPAGTVNVAYTPTTVAATGGTGPYTWSATGLPAGLSIGSGTGTISGTPTTNTGSPFNVTVTVTDNTSATANQPYSLTINPAPPPPSITGPASLPAGTAGPAYPATTVTATGGVTPYTWSATGLPAGLSIGSTTGTISGTPTTAGTFSVTVTVTDSISEKASASYSLTINAGPDFTLSASPGSETVTRGSRATYTVTVGSLNGFTGSVSLSASGGPSKSTYSFSPSSVTPPADSSGNSTLTITTSTRGGTGTFTVTVKGTYTVSRRNTVTHTTTVTLTTQ